MHRRKSWWFLGLCFLVSVFLAMPISGWAKEGHGSKFKQFRAQMMKNLNLSTDQAKQFKELEEKFVKQRMDLYGQLQKDMVDLKKAMAEKPVDGKKVEDAVTSIVDVKDKLTANYQEWWHEELKALKPEQQAHYLLDMNKWWIEVMAGHYKKEMAAEQGKPAATAPEKKPEKK
jgi:Spy/CpxP family protein refolding chaperone